MILEEAMDTTYPSLIRDSIFTPLNLTSSFLDGFEPIQGVIAHPWHEGEDYYLMPRTSIGTFAFAAGCIASTPQEMAQWYQDLFNDGFLPDSLIALMTDFIPYAGGQLTGIGLGLFEYSFDQHTYWGHGGNIRGYASHFLYEVEGSHSIAVCRNDTWADAWIVARRLAMALNDLVVAIPFGTSAEEVVNIYPNPASGEVTVDWGLKLQIEPLRVIIKDISGIVGASVTSSGSGSVVLDVSDFKPGIYLVQIRSEHLSTTRKLVVN